MRVTPKRGAPRKGGPRQVPRSPPLKHTTVHCHSIFVSKTNGSIFNFIHFRFQIHTSSRNKIYHSLGPIVVRICDCNWNWSTRGPGRISSFNF